MEFCDVRSRDQRHDDDKGDAALGFPLAEFMVPISIDLASFPNFERFVESFSHSVLPLINLQP